MGLVRLVGSCNGLVCILLGFKDFSLVNPSTKMYKKLPDLDHKMNGKWIVYNGFGCDEWSGDYKVFMTISDLCDIDREPDKCKLYSFKNNSWKIIENWDVCPSDTKGKFASGKLHWNRNDNYKSGIISFDLQREVYGVVERPSYSDGGFSESIGVIGGCLSILCNYPDFHMDVWVMKKYGVRESWAKVANVSVSHLQVHEDNPSSFPFSIGPNGEILLFYGMAFLIYQKDKQPRMINIDSTYEAEIYTESLVTLNLDGEHERPVA